MPPIDPFRDGQSPLQEDTPLGLTAPRAPAPGSDPTPYATPYALPPKYAPPLSPLRKALTVAAVFLALLFLFWGAGEQHYQSCVARSAAVNGEPSGCSILPWSRPE